MSDPNQWISLPCGRYLVTVAYLQGVRFAQDYPGFNPSSLAWNKAVVLPCGKHLIPGLAYTGPSKTTLVAYVVPYRAGPLYAQFVYGMTNEMAGFHDDLELPELISL